MMLSEYSFIDYIVVFDDDTPLELLKMIQPDYLVKGGDYNVENIIGKEYAKQTLIMPYIDGYSSSKYINIVTNTRV